MIYFKIAIAAVDLLLGAGMLYVLVLTWRRGIASSPGGARRLIGNGLIAAASAVLVFSGSLKLAHVAPVVDEMASLHLAGWKLNLVASLEIGCGLLFAVRPARSIGLLLTSAYLGAAICAHVQSDQYFAVMPTLAVLGCCWLGTALRHPQMLWSFGERAAARTRIGRNATGDEPAPAIAR